MVDVKRAMASVTGIHKAHNMNKRITNSVFNTQSVVTADAAAAVAVIADVVVVLVVISK